MTTVTSTKQGNAKGAECSVCERVGKYCYMLFLKFSRWFDEANLLMSYAFHFYLGTVSQDNALCS